MFELARPKASRSHPTTKPVELVTAMLTNSTRLGDLVCEPFAGSGSTLIAADRLSRRCYGIEVDPRYCDVVLGRWERFSVGQAAQLVDRPAAAAA